MKHKILAALEVLAVAILVVGMLVIIVITTAFLVAAFQIGGVGISMDAVDLWIVVAAVLFGVGALVSIPKLAGAATAYAMALVSGGLMCFMIGTLVARN